MAKSSYSVQPGNIFGRLGQALGRSTAEVIPKEVERYRLQQGLENVGKQEGLSPFQQFAALAGVPGITPQMLQSGGELLRQQSYLNALQNQYSQGGPKSGEKGYIPTKEELEQPMKGEVPTLATPEATAQSYKEYIPPTEQQERADANENFQANPARYNYNFENALNERKAITARNQEIQKAYQATEATALAKETKVKESLGKEIEKLGLNNLPPKVKQNYEEKIINSMLPKQEGGEGLTQEQAVKNYSEELRTANRNYLDLSALSVWSPADFNRRADSLQKEFASRGEQQLMMDQMISNLGISPSYAAHKAYPIQKGQIPTLNKIPDYRGRPTIPPKMTPLTYEKLKKEMGKSNSPLSIAFELQQKGLDPSEWLKYLDDHRENLEVWQADQLNKNLNIFDLKDRWLRAWE